MASLAIIDLGRLRSWALPGQNMMSCWVEMGERTSMPRVPLLVFLLSSSSAGLGPPAGSVLLRDGMAEWRKCSTGMRNTRSNKRTGTLTFQCPGFVLVVLEGILATG